VKIETNDRLRNLERYSSVLRLIATLVVCVNDCIVFLFPYQSDDDDDDDDVVFVLVPTDLRLF
jgi:hypothetical protein